MQLTTSKEANGGKVKAKEKIEFNFYKRSQTDQEVVLAHENADILWLDVLKLWVKQPTIFILFCRRESQGSRSSQPGPLQRKPSTDGNERYRDCFYVHE